MKRRAGLLNATLSAAVGMLLCAGCSNGPGDAGSIAIQHPHVIPPTPPEVQGPAMRGSVVTPDGRAVAGATVIVTTLLSNKEQNARNALGVFTFGFGCLLPKGCSSPKSTGATARNGAFALRLPKQNPGSDNYSITVVDDLGETARVATTLYPEGRDSAGADLGQIPLAATPASVVASGGVNHLVPAPLPARYVTRTTSLTLARATRTPAGGQLVADPPYEDITGGYDPRLIEDGQVILTASQDGQVGTASAIFSSSVAIRGTDVPESRGSSCTLFGSQGQPIPQDPCGLTDGVLDGHWAPRDDPACSSGPCPGTAQHDHRDVVVTTAHPIQATLLVIRGCGFTCHVSISADGRTFFPLRDPDQSASPDVLYVQPLHHTVSAVKVETSTGGFFDSLREVSVFS